MWSQQSQPDSTKVFFVFFKILIETFYHSTVWGGVGVGGFLLVASMYTVAWRPGLTHTETILLVPDRERFPSAPSG